MSDSNFILAVDTNDDRGARSRICSFIFLSLQKIAKSP